MQPRQSILEMFSTFLRLDENYDRGWSTNLRLKRNMETCLKQSNGSEQFWALYWHRASCTSHGLAVDHLAAYLQETCYKVSKKLSLDFAGYDSLEDFFQIAIARLHPILKGFNPQHTSNLKSYASLAFRNAITDTLRQRQIADVCTIWGLLMKVSQKRLLEAFQHLGLAQETSDCYLLAWTCFTSIYAPSEARASRQLTKPDAKMWSAIATLYNSQRSKNLPECTPELLEEWLSKAGQAVRSYLYPSFVSINALTSEATTVLEGATIQESLVTEIIEQEEEKTRSAQQTQVNQVLLRTLIKLDLEAQRLLQMYYGQELTQQEIACELEIKQYTVSRRLMSLRQSFLMALAQWSQTTLHQSLTSDLLNSMSPMLEEWLRTHYNYNPD